jgi:hypothetical protein
MMSLRWSVLLTAAVEGLALKRMSICLNFLRIIATSLLRPVLTISLFLVPLCYLFQFEFLLRRVAAGERFNAIAEPTITTCKSNLADIHLICEARKTIHSEQRRWATSESRTALQEVF